MGFWINAIIWAGIIGYCLWHEKAKLLTALCVISGFVGIETYLYVREWIWHLSTVETMMFFAIPLCLFVISSLIYSRLKHLDWEEAECMYFGVILAVWLSFPTVFLIYDWNEAKAKYETEMEEEIGEDWEEELEEYESEGPRMRPDN